VLSKNKSGNSDLITESFNNITSQEFDNIDFVFKSDNRLNSFDR